MGWLGGRPGDLSVTPAVAVHRPSRPSPAIVAGSVLIQSRRTLNAASKRGLKAIAPRSTVTISGPPEKPASLVRHPLPASRQIFSVRLSRPGKRRVLRTWPGCMVRPAPLHSPISIQNGFHGDTWEISLAS